MLVLGTSSDVHPAIRWLDPRPDANGHLARALGPCAAQARLLFLSFPARDG